MVEVFPGMRKFKAAQSPHFSQISSVFAAQETVAACPFFFIDTPGLTDKSDYQLQRRLAAKVDRILFFVDAGSCQMSQQTCDLLQFLAANNLFDRVSIVMSKIDQLDSKWQAI